MYILYTERYTKNLHISYLVSRFLYVYIKYMKFHLDDYYLPLHGHFGVLNAYVVP